MLPLHEGYAYPEPILRTSIIAFACAVASATQTQWLRGARRTALPAQPGKTERRLATVARVLTVWSLVLAVGTLILYLRYRLDPNYQMTDFSDYNVATVEQVMAITPKIDLLGQGTLVATVIFFCARLVAALRRHGRAERRHHSGAASNSSVDHR